MMKQVVTCFVLILDVNHLYGLPQTGAIPLGGAAFDEGTGPIFIDNAVCDGQELRLLDCASNPFAAHDCSHAEDAGVVCQPAISRNYRNADLMSFVIPIVRTNCYVKRDFLVQMNSPLCITTTLM